MDNVKLTFDDEALVKIAQQARAKKTGARGLRSIFERVLLDPMFHAPEDNIKSVRVGPNVIDGTEEVTYNDDIPQPVEDIASESETTDGKDELSEEI